MYLHTQAANYFSAIFTLYLGFLEEDFRIRLSKYLRFDDNNQLKRHLRTLEKFDVKVIHGFFGPKDARNILCLVCVYI